MQSVCIATGFPVGYRRCASPRSALLRRALMVSTMISWVPAQVLVVPLAGSGFRLRRKEQVVGKTHAGFYSSGSAQRVVERVVGFGAKHMLYTLPEIRNRVGTCTSRSREAPRTGMIYAWAGQAWAWLQPFKQGMGTGDRPWVKCDRCCQNTWYRDNTPAT